MIKNVYTKSDLILLGYSAAERDYAIGRNPVFTEKIEGRNFAYDQGEELMVHDTTAFCLRNYDLKQFEIGHTAYRENLMKILEFIE